MSPSNHTPGGAQAGAAATSSPEASLSAWETFPWKNRVEEPTNRYVYYPVAKRLVDVLMHTSVTPNQVTLIQPLIAAAAGYLIATGDGMSLVAGALLFEFRSMLDCADGTLARRKKLSSPNGHALDGVCDWLGVVFLYLGIYFHFRRFVPPTGEWATYLPMGAIIAISLAQGALRSLSADYYMRKFGSILARGRDETVEDLRDKMAELTPDTPIFARVDTLIGRGQHLLLQLEVFDPERSRSLNGVGADRLRAASGGPLMGFLARLWSVSNGDFYIRLSIISVLLGHQWMWQLQLFWATAGVVWILGVIGISGRFLKKIDDEYPVEASAAE